MSVDYLIYTSVSYDNFYNKQVKRFLYKNI